MDDDRIWTEARCEGDDGSVSVLVVGDANPDLVLQGDVVPRFGQAEQLLSDAALVLGGSAAIAAHALSRLGRPTRLLAAVGGDRFGEQVVADLRAAGVDTTPVLRRVGVPTGLTVVLSPPLGERAMLTLPGAIPTLTAEEVRAALGEPGVTHAHVASLYLQPQLVTVLPGLLAEARSRGVTTSLDTNDDPSGTWLGVEELLPHLDLLLPNAAEARALARGTDTRAAAHDLAARGPLVVVKDGARGAMAVSPDGTDVAVDAVPTEVVDTTGAGDAFDAAFLDGWLDRRDPHECLERAARAGSLVAAAVGGTAGQPLRGDLEDRDSDRDRRRA
jgi:ribokinase